MTNTAMCAVPNTAALFSVVSAERVRRVTAPTFTRVKGTGVPKAGQRGIAAHGMQRTRLPFADLLPTAVIGNGAPGSPAWSRPV